MVVCQLCVAAVQGLELESVRDEHCPQRSEWVMLRLPEQVPLRRGNSIQAMVLYEPEKDAEWQQAMFGKLECIDSGGWLIDAYQDGKK
jgi:hypothetical protein